MKRGKLKLTLRRVDFCRARCASRSARRAGPTARFRGGRVLGILSSLMLGWSHAAAAHPDSGQEFSELFGSFAWGLYLMVPIPFLVMGVIGTLLYRASRSRKGATLASGPTTSDPRLN